MHYVYILKCGDGSLYTGWTNDIQARVKAHSEGKGAKYTKGRGPITLQYYETYETKSEALKRECEIKSLTRTQKEELIKSKPLLKGFNIENLV